MEKHEAVVSGIMSSVGFDTLEVSEQTTKVVHPVLCPASALGWHHSLESKLVDNCCQRAPLVPICPVSYRLPCARG